MIRFNHIDQCINGWSKFRNACYKYINELKTWNDAERTCTEFGAHLTSIHSQEEADFTASLPGSSKPRVAWIGGDRSGNVGKWIDGTKFDFRNWKHLEPNNLGGNEKCIETFIASDNKWNDIPCNIPHSFLCKKQLGGGTWMKVFESKKWS